MPATYALFHRDDEITNPEAVNFTPCCAPHLLRKLVAPMRLIRRPTP